MGYFRKGDKKGLQSALREIDKKIREEKRHYRDKLENNFTGNNGRLYWRGIEKITGYNQQKRPVQTTDEAKLAEDLDTFYTRFDKHDFHMEQEQERVMSETQSRSSHPVVVSDKDVRACFRKVNPRSAAGPDKVSGRTPKECSESLAPVFTKLIQMSLDESYIPRIKFSTPCSHISWLRNFSQCL